MKYAIVNLQDYPTDKGTLLNVAVGDIHQIESGDTSFITEGCLHVVMKDLKTVYETFTPIRFESV